MGVPVEWQTVCAYGDIEGIVLLDKAVDVIIIATDATDVGGCHIGARSYDAGTGQALVEAHGVPVSGLQHKTHACPERQGVCCSFFFGLAPGFIPEAEYPDVTMLQCFAIGPRQSDQQAFDQDFVGCF